MFKRQKPDDGAPGRPDATAGKSQLSPRAAEPVARPLLMPGSAPASAPTLARAPGSGGLPPLPTPLPPGRTGSEPSRPSQDASPRRTLVVGRGISLQGTVQDAERLVVEGTVEASMVRATELSIAAGGVFKGGAEIQDADVAGTMDGTLTVRGNLLVRATGKVVGTARCHRLRVEEGGRIDGRVEMVTEAARAEEKLGVMEPAG